MPKVYKIRVSLPLTDDDWQEEHARLAELDERVRDGVGGCGDVSTAPLPPAARCIPPPSSLPPPGLEERGGGDLAESLTRLILGTDPAIAGLGAAEPERVRLPLHSHQQPPPSTLPGASHPLFGYQQHQHLLHRGTAPLQVGQWRHGPPVHPHWAHCAIMQW